MWRFFLATAAEGTAPEANTFLVLLTNMLPIIVVFAIMYLILLRPQRKREKALKEKLAQLKVGDNIVTIGGIIGKVCNIKDDVITIDISHDKQEKNKMKVQRWAIREVNTTD